MIAAGALLLVAAQSEQLVYRCRNAADEARFALTFERRGSRLRNVTVGDYGIPRLGGDVATRWQGRMAGSDAVFELSTRDPSLTARMRLAPLSGREHAYRLTWSSSIGGGHIVLDEPERMADCTLIQFEQANPTS